MTRASANSMSNEQRRTTHCFQTVRSGQLSRVVTTRAYLATRKKNKKKTRKEKKNQRRRNPYARVRRYKITSTLRLLLRGDLHDEGLRADRRLPPRARLSKLDITSPRLHRQSSSGAPFCFYAYQPSRDPA